MVLVNTDFFEGFVVVFLLRSFQGLYFMTDFNQDDRIASVTPQIIPPQVATETPNTRSKSLSSDELIALFLALTGIGSILFWTIAQKTSPINLSALTSGSPSFSNGALIGTTGATEVPQSSDGVPFTGTAQSSVSTNSGTIAANPNAAKINSAMGVDGTTQNQTNASKSINPTSEPVTIDQSRSDQSDNDPDNVAKTAAGVSAAGAIATTQTPLPQKSAAGTLDSPIQAKAFSDVPNGFWAKKEIVALSNRGVITGFSDGTFKPDQAINRAEFAGIIQKAFNQLKSKPVMKFTDIKDNFWATSAIDEATQTGFMTGYPGGAFKPEQAIPRLEMLSAIATGLQLAPKGDPIQTLSRYSDAKDLPKWAVSKVSSAIESGITIPNTTTLEPTKTATRADAAMFVYQALVKDGKIKP